jgi:tetratricopeptide (TPR) repeat protein
VATTSVSAGRGESNPVAPALSLGEQVLAHAQSSRDVVQDFCPLAESLEWELGQEYLRERGNKAFISDASPVPFVINNDGTLSRHAAEVFFTNCVEADKVGTLECDIFVLELGIGVGLFARFFLDTFRDLCLEHRKDYYDRLCYVAADRSERMLLDVIRHGVLANHPGRYRVRQVDAMEPGKELPYDAMFVGRARQPFRAVFLNYLLDCLPAAVLKLDGDQVKQLCVRTCVARNVKLADYTDMSIEALRERATSSDPNTRRELLEVYGLFASEYDYRPIDTKYLLPYSAFASEFGRKATTRLLHSYGAIQCLEKLLALLDNGGFILINDYGPTQQTRDDEFEHQRFSMATFVGVNFSLLKAFFGELDNAQWIEPAGDSRGIHSRLLGRRIGSETVTRFFEKFSDYAHDWLQEPIEQARACIKVGRYELAASFYNQALERQPRNWVLLNEISAFLTFQLGDAKAGIDIAKIALALNPACSAELWNTLGDGLYEIGRTVEARSAYLKALAVNESDVRSRYNLAWVYAREKNSPTALKMLAEAIAFDKTGEFRQRILQKQQEVLAQLDLRHQQEYLLLINLVSRFAQQTKKQRQNGEPTSTGEKAE